MVIKNYFGLLGIVFMLMLCGCSKYANRTVENPNIETATTTALDISKIEMTDSSTVMNFKVRYYPKYWVQLAERTYIEADGEKYYMVSADGITPGERLWIPESGEAEFTLVFPPIPASVKKINFGEEADSPWLIYGIDVTGKATADFPHKDLPKEMTSASGEGNMPEVVLDVDTTTVNVHLLSYYPALGNKLETLLNTMTEQVKDDLQIDIDEQGNGSKKILLYGSSNLVLMGLNGGTPLTGSIWLAPGETVDVYVDCRQVGQQIMAEREEREEVSNAFIFDNGKYSALNYLKQTEPIPVFFKYRSGKFGHCRMTGDEYVEYLKKEFKEAKDSIARTNLSPMMKEVALNSIEAGMLSAAENFRNVAYTNYYVTTGADWNEKIPDGAIKLQMTPENYKSVAAEVRNIDDLNLVMAPGVSLPFTHGGALSAQAYPESKLAELVKYRNLMNKVSLNKLDADDKAAIKSFTTPFFTKAIERHIEEVQNTINNADMSVVQPTPEVANDKLFDAIIAPHKGKVVMVDLWNTWCVPCRRALTKNEPEKAGDLSSDDIVWIYIADETSPLPAYLKLIPGIKGLHYRVNADQIKAIKDRFNVDGIPFYILVDRNGNAVGRPDLRDHSLFKKTLIEEVAKK